MQTHDDRDTPGLLEAEQREVLRQQKDKLRDTIAQLSARAEQMTEEGTNRITAGAPGEQPLGEIELGGIHVRRMPDDPLALRISVGEITRPRAIGAYLTFRGGREQCIALLERALHALRDAAVLDRRTDK